MEFAITPYVGVGPIALGLPRVEVRQHLVGRVQTFMKTRTSATPADAFEDYDLQVHYDGEDCCESVEFSEGRARLHAVPTFRGEHLVGRPLLEVQRWLSTIDADLREIDSTTICFGLGFGVSAPSPDADTPIRDVIVFRKGYYDRLLKSFKPLKFPVGPRK